MSETTAKMTAIMTAKKTKRSEGLWRPARRRVGRAVKLDSFLYRAVAEDPSLTAEAVGVAVLSALVMGLGLMIIGPITPIWWLLGGIAWATGAVAIGSWFFVFVGRRLGGRGRYDAMVRGLGYAVVPQALGFIPIAGFVPGFIIGGLWATACVTVAVREVHEISTGLAVRLVIAAMFLVVAFLPLVVTVVRSSS